MAQTSNQSVDLVRPSVKFGISILVLLVVRFIVNRLPMLGGSIVIPASESALPFSLQYSAIGVAILDTAILVLLFNFGRQIGGKLQTRYPTVEDIAKITRLVAVVVVGLIAYNIYGLIGLALLRDRTLYNLLFLVIVGIPLIVLLFLGYRHIDQLTGLVMGQLEGVAKSRTCPECGARLTGREKFCAACGLDLSSTEEKTTVASGTTASCFSCSRSVDTSTKFCPSCGCQLLCLSCGSRLEKDSDFCSKCGLKLNDHSESSSSSK